jgi:predicted O-linked N-acetylglucosamine transferase (SPINDLY family)
MSQSSGLLAQAKRRYDAGDIEDVFALCRQVLAAQPENAFALELMGVASTRRGQLPDAIDLLERAAALRPRDTNLLANLGAVYRMAGKADEAEAQFRRALSLRPDAISARFNLANLLWVSGRANEALSEYASVLERDPAHAGALNNMAAILKAKGRYAQAEMTYRQLVAVAPRDSAAHSNYGALLMEMGQTAAAISLYRAAISLAPDAVQPRNNLGVALLETGAFDEAVECLQEASERDSTIADVHANLGNALRKVGNVDGAAAGYDRALAISAAGGVRFKKATLLPAVAGSRDELDTWRQTMAEAVAALERDPPSLRDPYAEVGVTAFNLSYHDTNNRDLQASLARAYLGACPSLSFEAAHCGVGRAGSGNPKKGRLKVGFISRQFGTNAVGWCFHGVLRHMPRDEVSVVAIRFGESDDPLWQAIAGDVDQAVAIPAALDTARQRIAALELDVLVYTDIGMEPLTYFLAFARLAPLQCVLGGHPDTLGIPAIDLYISSDLQEPADAADHYAERLVRLPGAPTYYDRPALPSPLKPRSAFGLPESGAIYFCAQTLIKIHPDMDRLFAAILDADRDGLLVFPGGYNPALIGLLQDRFGRSLAPNAGRVRFLPALSHHDFMNVLALADVSLDTRPFGGGNGLPTRVAAGTPIVTWPGRFLRGRYTQALYRMIGVEDLVADSAEDYVAMAVTLARNSDARADVVQRIEAGAARAFSDMTHVKALRDTLVEQARA